MCVCVCERERERERDLETPTMSRPMSDFDLTLQRKIITNRFKKLKHAALLSPHPTISRVRHIVLTNCRKLKRTTSLWLKMAR